MHTPKISVIMPVYNAEPFLKESIKSILNQTYTDFELLILNDKSTDNSLEVIQQCQQKDSRIVVINKKTNVGPANLRNEGIHIAKGNFIALMDADDIALPNRFKKQVEVLENNPDIGVCGTWFTFFGSKKDKVIRHGEDHNHIKISFLHSCGIGNPTIMLKKEILNDFEFNNDYVPVEDYDLWSRLLPKTKFHNIQESLLNYRQHNNNISKTKIDNVNKSIKRVKANQMTEFGINSTDPEIDFYINAVSVKRGLLPDEIIKIINASKFLLSQNVKLKNFDHLQLEEHIERTLIRTIRNASKYNFSYYNHLRKNENNLFQKINTLDKVVLLFKSIISLKK